MSNQTPRSEADALNDAIDALLEGGDVREARLGLPSDLHGLLERGSKLHELAPRVSGAPRPTFLLGLEEQLRTDLRLRVGSGTGTAPNPSTATTWRQAAGYRAGRLARRLPIFLAALLAATAALMIFSQRAVPGDPLYPIKRHTEAVVLVLAGANGDESAAYFSLGRRRLSEVAAVVGSPRSSMSLDRLLDEMIAMYGRGIAAAARSSDDRALVRARLETRAAEAELLSLSDNATVRDRPEIDDARDTLAQLLGPVRDVSAIDGPPVAVARRPFTATPATPPRRATADASSPPTAVPPAASPTESSTPAPALRLTSTPSATLPAETVGVPTIEATPEPPDQPTTNSAHIPPTATATPPPSATPDAGGNSATATPTSDMWPPDLLTPTTPPEDPKPPSPTPVGGASAVPGTPETPAGVVPTPDETAGAARPSPRAGSA